MGFSLSSVGAVFGGIGGMAAGLVGASANANRKNANAMREYGYADLAAWEKANKQNREDLAPWTTMGKDATGRLTSMTMGTAEEAKNAMLMDPGYQWRVDQGQQAVERSAAGRGNFFSGNTGVALQKYGQDMAMDEYDRAFNRLMGISTQGLSATQTQTGSTENVAKAGSNAAYMNMNADISRNDFWPKLGWQAANTALQVAPMFAGAGGGGAGAGGASFAAGNAINTAGSAGGSVASRYYQ